MSLKVPTMRTGLPTASWSTRPRLASQRTSPDIKSARYSDWYGFPAWVAGPRAPPPARGGPRVKGRSPFLARPPLGAVPQAEELEGQGGAADAAAGEVQIVNAEA